MQLPAGFGSPITGSEMERLAQKDAVASEEIQNALDRAEEETFSNSEPEGDSEPESESGVLIPLNEPEDDDSDSYDTEDSGSDGELPLALPAKAAEFTFQNPTTAEEWKVAEARLSGNKRANRFSTRRYRNWSPKP